MSRFIPPGDDAPRIGDRVEAGGRHWIVVGEDLEYYFLRAENGETATFSREDVNVVVSERNTLSDRRVARNGEGAVWDSNTTQAFTARTLESHIREVLDGSPRDFGQPRNPLYDPRTTSQGERDISKAAELTNAGHAMTARTVRELRSRYRRQGIRGLYDHRSVGSGRATGVDPRVVDLITELLGLRTNSSTISKSVFFTQAELEANRRFEGDMPIWPNRRTLYRLVESLDPSGIAFGSAPRRRSLAGKQPRTYHGTQVTRPGERFEIDSTVFDAFVLYGEELALRPYLTIIVDVATRSLWGLFTAGDPKAEDVVRLLRKAATPMPMWPAWRRYLERLEDMAEEGDVTRVAELSQVARWMPYVIPQSIKHDHGKVFTSGQVRRFCDRFQIELHPCRANVPGDKPYVESHFGSINTEFTQHLSSYAGRDIPTRGKDPASKAELSLAQLQMAFDAWVAEYWQQREHSGLLSTYGTALSTPAKVWTQRSMDCGIVPFNMTAVDRLEILPARFQTIQDYGVNIKSRRYDAKEFDMGAPDQPRGRKCRTTPEGKWEIRWDPDDIDAVWVRSEDGSWIEADWNYRGVTNVPMSDTFYDYVESGIAADRKVPAKDVPTKDVVSKAVQLLKEVLEMLPKPDLKAVALERARREVIEGAPSPDMSTLERTAAGDKDQVHDDDEDYVPRDLSGRQADVADQGLDPDVLESDESGDANEDVES